MNVYLYTAHITTSPGGLQFLLSSEIERQLVALFPVVSPGNRHHTSKPLFFFKIFATLPKSAFNFPRTSPQTRLQHIKFNVNVKASLTSCTITIKIKKKNIKI